MPRKVLHIFMVHVYYFSQLAPVHHLLKHPHVYGGVEFRILSSVGTHYLGDGGTPALFIVRS